MKIKKQLCLVMGVLLIGICLMSCTDDISNDDHYKRPSWLRGNAYEVLQKEGNYSIFLKGIDLSGYKSIVDGNSVLTVMAPNDDAFKVFLTQKGYSTIEEMQEKSPLYLKKLIAYHLIYYSYDWDKLVNFRPSAGDGATDQEKKQHAGYYYKYRTHSFDPVGQSRVKLTPNASSDTLIHIYHYERYLPIFSDQLFKTKGIDPVYNYQYFYPHSKWNGINNASGSFNVSNAQVSDKGNVITDNGYIYHVDQVLEPLNTIYDELKIRPKYSDFLNLYDTFSTYSLADDATNTNLGYQAYIHEHGVLPKIAVEWPTLDYKQMDILKTQGYNIFVPSNTAIDNFFKTYWTSGCGYNSLNNLDPLILRYFIYQFFTRDNMIVFPEEIKKGKVLTYYGTPVNIDPDQVTDRVICENGTLYGMDRIDVPAIFSSVLGPALKDSTYIDYLYALSGSNLILSLASNKSCFVALIPNNQQFYYSDPSMRLYSTTSGKVLQQYSDVVGDYTDLSSSAMLDIVNMHTASNISGLKMDGTQVVQTNKSFNYWYMHNGKITTNALFNQQLEPEYTGTPFVNLHEISNNGKAWNNGRAYSYDATAIFHTAAGDGLAHKLAVCNDKNYPYYLFAQLLQKSGLVDGKSKTISNKILPTTDTRFIVFIPTNEAIKKNIKDIPGCSKLKVSNGVLSGSFSSSNKRQLAAYLCSYFITSAVSIITTYPYPGSDCHGTFHTAGSYQIRIQDNGSQLSVNFVDAKNNNNVSVNSRYFYLPFAFNDGCFHLIDGILK